MPYDALIAEKQARRNKKSNYQNPNTFQKRVEKLRALKDAGLMLASFISRNKNNVKLKTIDIGLKNEYKRRLKEFDDAKEYFKNC